MILYVHSDSSYTFIAKDRSLTEGKHFLSDSKPKATDYNSFVPLMNGIIHAVYKILRNVMPSAAESELGLIFVNAQDAAPIRTTLIEMNQSKAPTPIQVDNYTALGISNETINQMMSKALDMKFYWIWCIINQDQFIVYWEPGKYNLVDYPTKHPPPPANHIA